MVVSHLFKKGQRLNLSTLLNNQSKSRLRIRPISTVSISITMINRKSVCCFMSPVKKTKATTNHIMRGIIAQLRAKPLILLKNS